MATDVPPSTPPDPEKTLEPEQKQMTNNTENEPPVSENPVRVINEDVSEPDDAGHEHDEGSDFHAADFDENDGIHPSLASPDDTDFFEGVSLDTTVSTVPSNLTHDRKLMPHIHE